MKHSFYHECPCSDECRSAVANLLHSLKIANCGQSVNEHFGRGPQTFWISCRNTATWSSCAVGVSSLSVLHNSNGQRTKGKRCFMFVGNGIRLDATLVRACGVRHAACGVRHAACGMRCAACGLWLAVKRHVAHSPRRGAGHMPWACSQLLAARS
jgi:hypothetical protein